MHNARGAMTAFLSRLGCLIFLALPSPSLAQSGFSEASQMFINTCLQHAPAFQEGAIAASVAQQRFKAPGRLAGAGVEVNNGRSCTLHISAGNGALPFPSDQEVQQLAIWYAQRIGGQVTRRKSAIGGDVWYEVRAGKAKYGVSVSGDSRRMSFHATKR